VKFYHLEENVAGFQINLLLPSENAHDANCEEHHKRQVCKENDSKVPSVYAHSHNIAIAVILVNALVIN
jgi:hypothetical protein